MESPTFPVVGKVQGREARAKAVGAVIEAGDPYGRQAKKRRKGWQEGRQKKQEGKKNNGHKNKSASGSKNCFKILDQSYSGL